MVLVIVSVLLWKGKNEGFAAETKGYIALTFDDGPHGIYTQELLDGLEKRDVKASFFILGENIEGNEAIIRRMYESGHLIGNHTYRHIQMTTANHQKVCDYVNNTNDMLSEITGVKPDYLRPPFGDWNEELDCLMDMTTVFWSIDSLDWKYQKSSPVVRQVIKKAGDGDIVLMHDIFPSSVEAALEIIDQLQAQGYEFVTVDELLID